MKIVTNETLRVELNSLKPGDVFTWGESLYWIVSDVRDGNKIHVLQLNGGVLLPESGSSMVIPVPDAYVQIP